MSDHSAEGVLDPKELKIVARAVKRLCDDQNIRRDSVDGEHLAARAILLFQRHRHFDEDALMGALREDS